jgi:GntR family transcriptional regulator
LKQNPQTARRAAALGDLDEGAPLHSRVREAIRRQVRNGELVDESGRLMTEAELVKHFGVSRITIRNAIQPLVAEGIFSRERGRGTFLRSNEPEHWAGRLMGFSEILKDVGQEPGARIISQGMTNRLEPDVRDALRERAVFELRRLRLADGAPIAIEHAFYPPDIGLELEKRDLTSIVMYRVFESDLGLDIEHATQTISASLATRDDAKLLGVKVGSALISLERLTTSSEGRPLEFLRSAYMPEYFRFTVHLTRGRSGAQLPANATTRD